MPLDQGPILARAKQHLARGSAEDLRYAALECRLLMEELTYEKLRAFADLLPAEELNRWQPREAVKLLLSLDKNADQSAKVEMSAGALAEDWTPTEENLKQVEWTPLGDHHALSLKWLNNYHKVGNLLHAPKASDASVMPETKQRKLLREVIDELERAVRSTITTMVWRGGIGFDCEGCGRRLVASIVTLRQGSTVLCPNDDCQFEYVLGQSQSDEESPPVVPVAKSFPCPVCSAVTMVARRRLRQGYEFKCATCSTRYRVLEPRWLVAKT